MRLSELRRSERERAAVPSKTADLGHPAALAFLADKDLSRYAVTMTELPKVGVNPRSKYNTPVGIYFYPADYYVDNIKNDEGLPFQHGAKYINIIELTTNDIMYLDDETERDFERIVQRLQSLKIGKDEFEQEQYERLIRYLVSRSDSDAKVQTPGGKIWFLLYQVSRSIGDLYHKRTKSFWQNPITQQIEYRPPPRSALAWNWLIRKLGYKVIIDSGTSVIHENEPDQGVIIDPAGTFRVVKRIQNISGPDLREKEILTFLNSDKATDADRIKAVQNNHHIFVKLNNPSEAVQIAAVEQHPWYFNRIKNPSLDVQRIAVKTIPTNVLVHLNDLRIPIAPEIQELAVEVNPVSIKYIANPTEELQIKAVNGNPDVIELISKPTYKAKQLAVTLMPSTIELIWDADFELKKMAVSANPYIFSLIKNTNEQERYKLAMIAVNKDPESIRNMINPPIAVQIAAVSQNGRAIAGINDPEPAVQMAAVKQNPKSIMWILAKGIVPSEDIQVAAVSADPGMLRMLPRHKIRPSARVLQAAGQTG